MDPIAVAASVVALLSPMLKKASEEFAGKAGAAVFDKAQELLSKLKQRWRGDAFAEETVSRFEADPDRYGVYLQDLLVERLGADETLAVDILRCLSEIRAVGPELRVVQKIRFAERVTGLEADELTAGKVQVEQEMSEATDVTGIRIGRLGPSTTSPESAGN